MFETLSDLQVFVGAVGGLFLFPHLLPLSLLLKPEARKELAPAVVLSVVSYLLFLGLLYWCFYAPLALVTPASRLAVAVPSHGCLLFPLPAGLLSLYFAVWAYSRQEAGARQLACLRIAGVMLLGFAVTFAAVLICLARGI